MKYDHVCTKAIQQIAQRITGVTYTLYKIDILNHKIQLKRHKIFLHYTVDYISTILYLNKQIKIK